jgi:micrococcal nuclease
MTRSTPGGHRAVAVITAAFMLWAVAAVTSVVRAAAACELDEGPVRAVAAVIDGETLRLDDGGEVRLIGALAPRSRDADADPEIWLPEQEARGVLERLVGGQTVALAFAGTRTDRNGRMLAHAFVGAGAARVWVQGYMVENGHARAYALPGNAVCIAELMVLEARARAAGLGLWRNAAYAVRTADRPRDLLRQRETFQLVEGRVRSVSDAKGHVYLNFGDDWHTDFTAHLGAEPRRQLERAMTGGAAGDSAGFAALNGRRVRVRGWITWRNGPYIDLHDQNLVERLD